jgi:hypothetical protein
MGDEPTAGRGKREAGSGTAEERGGLREEQENVVRYHYKVLCDQRSLPFASVFPLPASRFPPPAVG